MSMVHQVPERPLKCHTRWHQYPYPIAHFSFADGFRGHYRNGSVFECPRCGTKYLFWSYGENNPFMKLRWWHLKTNRALRLDTASRIV